MRRSVLVLIIVLVVSVSGWAQEKPKKASRPDIPGSFMIDLGVNRALHSPPNFSQAFWGSRTMNFYYQYPLRLGHSNFSFNPGVGLSLERFKFKNNYTLKDTVDDGIRRYELVPAGTYYKGAGKSMLVTNYVEIPLEFRFDTNPEDLGRSFNFAFGGRFGYLYDSFNKVKYKENGETKKVKDKQNMGLTQFRYGIYSRLGVGPFNIFCFYNLSPMFEPNKGPSGTTMNTLTCGISLNGF